MHINRREKMSCKIFTLRIFCLLFRAAFLGSVTTFSLASTFRDESKSEKLIR